MKKLALLTGLLSIIITTNANASGSHFSGEAKINQFQAEASEELLSNLRIASHGKAIENCSKSRAETECIDARVSTSCSTSIGKKILTLTDIISEEEGGVIGYTVSCKTNLSL